MFVFAACLDQCPVGIVPFMKFWTLTLKLGMDNDAVERRGSVMVSTFACHAADPGSLPGPGMCHY